MDAAASAHLRCRCDVLTALLARPEDDRSAVPGRLRRGGAAARVPHLVDDADEDAGARGCAAQARQDVAARGAPELVKGSVACSRRRELHFSGYREWRSRRPTPPGTIRSC